MTNLTPEQQQVVDKAAKAHADDIWVNEIAGLYKRAHLAQSVHDFKTGLNFALSTPSLYMGLMEEFAEWIRTFEVLERQNGQWVIESQLSDKDIVKAFIEDKNNKKDGQ